MQQTEYDHTPGAVNTSFFEWIGRRRVYLQALIDQEGWTLLEIDQFADRVAADRWADTHLRTAEAGAVLLAFMKGYEVGGNNAYDNAYADGVRAMERLVQKHSCIAHLPGNVHCKQPVAGAPAELAALYCPAHMPTTTTTAAASE